MSPPEVTVIVPVFNEEAAIEEMATRLLGQTFGDFEAIFADGRSTDRTRELLHGLAQCDQRVRVVDNPGRIQSAGLNEALAVARGRLVVRLDGHSFPPDDYIERCVALLDETGAGVVGGRMDPMPSAGLYTDTVTVTVSY